MQHLLSKWKLLTQMHHLCSQLSTAFVIMSATCVVILWITLLVKFSQNFCPFWPFWAVFGQFGPFWAVLGQFGPFACFTCLILNTNLSWTFLSLLARKGMSVTVVLTWLANRNITTVYTCWKKLLLRLTLIYIRVYTHSWRWFMGLCLLGRMPEWL